MCKYHGYICAKDTLFSVIRLPQIFVGLKSLLIFCINLDDEISTFLGKISGIGIREIMDVTMNHINNQELILICKSLCTNKTTISRRKTAYL